MRNKIVTALAVLAFSFTLLTPAFAGGQLTNQKAYAAIAQAMGGSGNFKRLNIVGVLETQQNVAVADYSVDNLILIRAQNDAITAYAFGSGGGAYRWSGSGKATFVHYNDGNWKMIDLSAGNSVWSGLNILVK